MKKVKAATGEVIDLTYERTLKEKLQRQLLEIEIALERGELELMEPVEARYANKVMTCKAEFLAMPEKIRHLLQADYGKAIDVEYLNEIVYQTLTTLSECKGEDLPRYDPSEKTPAA